MRVTIKDIFDSGISAYVEYRSAPRPLSLCVCLAFFVSHANEAFFVLVFCSCFFSIMFLLLLIFRMCFFCVLAIGFVLFLCFNIWIFFFFRFLINQFFFLFFGLNFLPCFVLFFSGA